MLAAVAGVVWWAFLTWREHRFDKLIAAAASRYQIDPALVKAVIWRESRFDPDARGRAGEMGLMQIGEEAAQEWASAERLGGLESEACFDPATNILAGAWYLKKALRRYSRTDDPAPYALADYNAGRGNVLKWLDGAAATNSAVFIAEIRFPSSRDYVREILLRCERYHRRGEFKL